MTYISYREKERECGGGGGGCVFGGGGGGFGGFFLWGGGVVWGFGGGFFVGGGGGGFFFWGGGGGGMVFLFVSLWGEQWGFVGGGAGGERWGFFFFSCGGGGGGGGSFPFLPTVKRGSCTGVLLPSLFSCGRQKHASSLTRPNEWGVGCVVDQPPRKVRSNEGLQSLPARRRGGGNPNTFGLISFNGGGGGQIHPGGRTLAMSIPSPAPPGRRGVSRTESRERPGALPF